MSKKYSVTQDPRELISKAQIPVEQIVINFTGDVTGKLTLEGGTVYDVNIQVNDNSHAHNADYYTQAQIDSILAGNNI